VRHQNIPRRSPSHTFAGEQQCRGEVGANLIEIVKYRGYGSAFAMPARDQAQEMLARTLIHGCKGLVEQNQLGILYDQSGEKDTLELPGGERLDGLLFETVEPDRGQGLLGSIAQFPGDGMRPSDPVPMPEQHSLDYGNRKAPFDFAVLW
jgi:hypothetical protein